MLDSIEASKERESAWNGRVGKMKLEIELRVVYVERRGGHLRKLYTYELYERPN